MLVDGIVLNGVESIQHFATNQSQSSISIGSDGMDFGSISLKRTNLAPIAEAGPHATPSVMLDGTPVKSIFKRPTKPDKTSQRAHYKKQQ